MKCHPLFTKIRLSSSSRTPHLQAENEGRILIEQSFMRVQVLLNENGGQFIFGCGKQGIINNKILLGNNDAKNDKTLADYVKIYFTSSLPPNDTFDDSSQPLYQRLEPLKFDLASISQKVH